MKTEKEVDAVLSKITTIGFSEYPNMTYEQGVENALLWVLEILGDDEFEFAKPLEEQMFSYLGAIKYKGN